VGPLLLASLVGRWASTLVMPEPIYHVLSESWHLVRVRVEPEHQAQTGTTDRLDPKTP